MNKDERIKARLRELAADDTCDPEIYDDMDGGGNSPREIHEIGVSDGRIILAQELLEEFFSEDGQKPYALRESGEGQ